MRIIQNSKRFAACFFMLIFLLSCESALAFSFWRPLPENNDPTVLSRYQNQSYTKGVSEDGIIIKFSYVDNLVSFKIETSSGKDVTPAEDQYSKNTNGTLILLSPEYLQSLERGKYIMTGYFGGTSLEACFCIFDSPSAKIIEQPATVYANSGDNVTFRADVAVTGKDATCTSDDMGITYQWYRASRSGKKKVRGAVSRILQLNEVPDELTGYTYWCEITVPGYSAPFVTNRVKLYIIGAGDSSHLALYATLSTFALVAMVCMILTQKRKLHFHK